MTDLKGRRICIVVQHGYLTELPPDMRDLEKVGVRSEWELHKFMRERPELLPLDDGCLLVVGIETPIRPWYVDMVGLTPSGDIVLIEFKKGLENPDFRYAIAQLLDYGAHHPRLALKSFEIVVARRYFNSRYCTSEYRGTKFLRAAFEKAWPDRGPEEFKAFTERLGHVLSSGTFRFVVVAQDFTDAMKRTTDYLNTINSNVKFYLVQMVKLKGPSGEAFQANVVRGPALRALSQASFLAKVDDEALKHRYSELFTDAERLGYLLDWSTLGMSIRLPHCGKEISVAWIYPPGAKDARMDPSPQGFTFGYYPDQVDNKRKRARVRRALKVYAAALSKLEGAQTPTRKREVNGRKFESDRFSTVASQVVELLTRLAELAS